MRILAQKKQHIVGYVFKTTCVFYFEYTLFVPSND